LDQSSRNIADPNSCDLANAAMNWAALKVRPTSMFQTFCKASTQVSAGSQQLVNQGLYCAVSARINNITALVMLSDMEIDYPTKSAM
jgi:hypothetical protein